MNNGATLLLKIASGESSFNMKAVSSAGAGGATQFIPTTRQSYISQYGVDPWKSPDEAIHATALFLKHQGLAAYNPGGGQGYIDYILGQSVEAKGAARPSPSRPSQQPSASSSSSGGTGGHADAHRPGRGPRPRRGGPDRARSHPPVRQRAGAAGMNAAEADIVQIGRVAEQKFGLTVSENPHFGGVNPVHATDSYHYRGLAIDASGPQRNMDAFAAWLERRYGPHIAELIHNGGSGYSIKGGKREPASFWGSSTWANHADHVHVALDPSMVRGKGLTGLLGIRFRAGTKQQGWSPSGAITAAPLLSPFLNEDVTEATSEGVDAAGNLAAEVVSGIFDLIHPESLMLNIALLGGGAFLVYYGAALMLGVKKPVATPAKAAAVAAAVPK